MRIWRIGLVYERSAYTIMAWVGDEQAIFVKSLLRQHTAASLLRRLVRYYALHVAAAIVCKQFGFEPPRMMKKGIHCNSLSLFVLFPPAKMRSEFELSARSSAKKYEGESRGHLTYSCPSPYTFIQVLCRQMTSPFITKTDILDAFYYLFIVIRKRTVKWPLN